MPKASLKQQLLEDVLRSDSEVQTAKHRPSLNEIAKRRAARKDFGDSPQTEVTFTDYVSDDSIVPDWLITTEYKDSHQGTIKSGKEGDVILVVRESPQGRNLLALKRYRSAQQRMFHRDQVYREGRKVAKTRVQKAVDQGTEFGRSVMAHQWYVWEYEYMKRLWETGVSVPYPVELSGGLLMQFIGDETQAAPRLIDARLDAERAPEVFEQVIAGIFAMVKEGIIHADLSPYNILYWQSQAWFIDFPQAVDLASNPHASDLLLRDIRNVCKFFGKFGISSNPDEILATALGAFY